MSESKPVDNRDNREIIIDSLQSLGGWQKAAGEYQMVQCPFHPDKTPSCGVYVSLDKPEFLGHFRCFGCLEKGNWNTFAEKTGLPQIQEWKNKTTHSADLADASTEEALLGSSSLTARGVLKQLGVPEAQPWPVSMEWRGFPGVIVRKAGGYIAFDNYNDSIQLIFVIKYAGQVRGGVKAIYERTKKGQTGYIAMRGSWVNKYGLLFINQAKTVIERNDYRFVVLVEGPRDALRLLMNGIPTIAVLGASTMTKSKALMLTSLDVDRVYVLPDNDKGGDTFWAIAKKCLKPILPTTLISLPKVNAKGKPAKIDPGNMSVELLNDLVVMLKRKQEFVRRKTLI